MNGRSASSPRRRGGRQANVLSPRFPLRALALIWGSWLAMALILGLLNSAAGPATVAAEILILLHAGLGVIILALLHDGKSSAILGAALIIRTALVFWDLNFSNVLLLPNSGSDTEIYFFWAQQVAQKPSLIFEDIRGEVYSKVMGLLFWVTGVLRSFGQYTNALLGMSVVLLMEDILERIHLDDAQRLRVLTVVALLPNAMVLSAIFLRESLISFLVAVSIYFFVRWFHGGGAWNILVVAAAVMAASTLHAGVIAVGIGYMAVVPFYRRAQGRFGVSLLTVMYLGFFAVIVYFVIAQYPDLFLGKFEAFESESDLLKATNYRGGGSQYLSDLTIASYGDLVRVGPLRALYFLASPMPWDFRGLVDLVTFALDSLFYIGVPAVFLLKGRQIDPRWRPLGYALLVILAVSSLLFGAGVSNAGTAARHRFKLVSLVMVLFIVVAKRIKTSGAATRAPGQAQVAAGHAALFSDERTSMAGTGAPVSGRVECVDV